MTAFVLLASAGPSTPRRGRLRDPASRPVPTTFGYHEVFHACTLLAALLHYLAVMAAVQH